MHGNFIFQAGPPSTPHGTTAMVRPVAYTYPPAPVHHNYQMTNVPPQAMDAKEHPLYPTCSQHENDTGNSTPMGMTKKCTKISPSTTLNDVFSRTVTSDSIPPRVYMNMERKEEKAKLAPVDAIFAAGKLLITYPKKLSLRCACAMYGNKFQCCISSFHRCGMYTSYVHINFANSNLVHSLCIDFYDTQPKSLPYVQ